MATSDQVLCSVVILCVLMASASLGHQENSDYKHLGKRTPCIKYSNLHQTESTVHGFKVENGHS